MQAGWLRYHASFREKHGFARISIKTMNAHSCPPRHHLRKIIYSSSGFRGEIRPRQPDTKWVTAGGATNLQLDKTTKRSFNERAKSATLQASLNLTSPMRLIFCIDERSADLTIDPTSNSQCSRHRLQLTEANGIIICMHERESDVNPPLRGCAEYVQLLSTSKG